MGGVVGVGEGSLVRLRESLCESGVWEAGGYVRELRRCRFVCVLMGRRKKQTNRAVGFIGLSVSHV